MKTRRFQVAFVATIVWFIIMTFLSHQNGEDTAKASSRLMKLFWFLDAGQVEIVSSWTRRGAHVFCFMVLTVLLIKLLRIAKLHAWIGVLAVCVWCFFDEWTKRSIPGRHYSTFDVMLNAAGVLLGWLMSRGGFWRHEESFLLVTGTFLLPRRAPFVMVDYTTPSMTNSRCYCILREEMCRNKRNENEKARMSR